MHDFKLKSIKNSVNSKKVDKMGTKLGQITKIPKIISKISHLSF